MADKHTRIIKCPDCAKEVVEEWEVEGHGITNQHAWCTCGWGGSYPFQMKNPLTKEEAEASELYKAYRR